MNRICIIPGYYNQTLTVELSELDLHLIWRASFLVSGTRNLTYKVPLAGRVLTSNWLDKKTVTNLECHIRADTRCAARDELRDKCKYQLAAQVDCGDWIIIDIPSKSMPLDNSVRFYFHNFYTTYISPKEDSPHSQYQLTLSPKQLEQISIMLWSTKWTVNVEAPEEDSETVVTSKVNVGALYTTHIHVEGYRWCTTLANTVSLERVPLTLAFGRMTPNVYICGLPFLPTYSGAKQRSLAKKLWGYVPDTPTGASWKAKVQNYKPLKSYVATRHKFKDFQRSDPRFTLRNSYGVREVLKILNDPDGIKFKYLSFCAQGGSKYPFVTYEINSDRHNISMTFHRFIPRY